MNSKFLIAVLCLLILPACAFASNDSVPDIFGIRIEFVLFGLTLLGVAFFHKHTMLVALAGLVLILIFRLTFTHFSLSQHIFGSATHDGEWRILLNLCGLLLGFAILAKHFEESRIPEILSKFLPDDWKGSFVLLVLIMVISSFLDNIAAAMIGGTIALFVFKGKVHMGYLAAIIAASNAGGAGSVLGDTTTTLMWIDGVKPFQVLHGFVASGAAILLFGIVASVQQDRYQRIIANPQPNIKIDWGKVFIVILILLSAIVTNWWLGFPALGVWIAILIGTTFRKTSWNEMSKAWQGTIFLVALVTCASLMPVEELPKASWQTAFSLGFVSAVFDNIPLTKLCLEQGGYDWGILAFTVGFGGSMIWFGSSAGVALSNMFPEAKSVVKYVKNGWHVTVAYIISFFIMLGIMGWNPHPPHKKNNRTEEIRSLESSVKHHSK